MLQYIRLFRYKNLLTLAFMLLVFHFGFLKLQNIELALKDWQFLLFILATILVFGAGNLMNAIIDFENINTKNHENSLIGNTFSESNANTLYIILNRLGGGIGFYLSNVIGKPNFASLFIIIAVINYFTVSTLAKNSPIRLFLNALMPAISLISVGIFDIIPTLNQENTVGLLLLFKILLDYAIFTFLIHLLIEILENLEIVITKKSWLINQKSASFIGILLVLGNLFYIYKYLFANQLYSSVLYFIITMISPLIYILIPLLTDKKQTEFRTISYICKVVFFFGIISIFLITLNIKHYV